MADVPASLSCMGSIDKTLTPEELSLDSSLLEVCNAFGRDVEGIANHMDAHGVDVEKVLPKIYSFEASNSCLLKASYREHVQAGRPRPSFRCRAMRESRHGILLWVPQDQKQTTLGSWHMISNQFVRGAEVLSAQTLKAGVQTENVADATDLSDFADSQQAIMRKLLGPPETAIQGYLTFKADGSLVGINWYKFDSTLGQFWHECLKSADNPLVHFAVKWLDLAEQKGWSYFPVLRSNNAVFLDSSMRYWLITALAEEHRQHTEVANGWEIGISATPDFDSLENELLPIFLAQSMDLLLKMPENVQESAVVSMSFEAICPGRRTYWGSLQEGLAASYERGRVKFLGCSHGSGKVFPTYLCHAAIAQSVMGAGISQPAFAKVETAGQVNDAVMLLSKVLRAEITEADFFAAFLSQEARLLPDKDLALDPEGFVLVSDDGEYSKVKVQEYYICHKFRADRLDAVREIPLQVGRYYPLVAQVDRALSRSEDSTATPRLLHQLTASLTATGDALKSQIEMRSGPIFDDAKKAMIERGLAEEKFAVLCSEPKKILMNMIQLNSKSVKSVALHRLFYDSLNYFMKVDADTAVFEFKNLFQMTALQVDFFSEAWRSSLHDWFANGYHQVLSEAAVLEEVRMKHIMRKKKCTADESAAVKEFSKMSSFRNTLHEIWKSTSDKEAATTKAAS